MYVQSEPATNRYPGAHPVRELPNVSVIGVDSRVCILSDGREATVIACDSETSSFKVQRDDGTSEWLVASRIEPVLPRVLPVPQFTSLPRAVAAPETSPIHKPPPADAHTTTQSLGPLSLTLLAFVCMLCGVVAGQIVPSSAEMSNSTWLSARERFSTLTPTFTAARKQFQRLLSWTETPPALKCADIYVEENRQCRAHVLWAFETGRFETHAAVSYANLTSFAGIEHSDSQVKIDDFQRLFYCEAPLVRSCSLPPCHCTAPPCGSCSSGVGLLSAPDVTDDPCQLFSAAPAELDEHTRRLLQEAGYVPSEVAMLCQSRATMKSNHALYGYHRDVVPVERVVMGANQPTPQLDEHNHRLLQDAGYSPSEVAMLFSASASNVDDRPLSGHQGQQHVQQRQQQLQRPERQQDQHQEKPQEKQEKKQQEIAQLDEHTDLLLQQAGHSPSDVAGEAFARACDLDKAQRLLKGISYSPIPFKRQQWIPSEDFMSDRAQRFWSPLPEGRGDLDVIRLLGANAVRVQGVDPYLWHGSFLDEAQRQGLQVIVGMSDYPFFQMPGNCASTDFDCFSQTRSDFRAALRSGYIEKGSYHCALAVLVMADEPDIKMVRADEKNARPDNYCRGIVSAVDALLDAEREAGVKHGHPKLTAAFSFTQCGLECGQHGSIPGLGQIAALHQAFLQPQNIGYSPRNNVTQAYLDRFVHGINTGRATLSELEQFQVAYNNHFPGRPCLITEGGPEPRDVLQLTQTPGTMLRGAVLAEFQTRHDHVDTEGQLGLFNLGQQDLGRVDFFGTPTPLWCLEPRAGRPAELAKALGGDSKAGSSQCGNEHLEF